MFAVLHIADFPLHAVLRTEPGPAECPAALFDGTSKKSSVLAANRLARSAGVQPGLTAPQAVARCPSLLIRTAQPAAESEARALLLALAFTLSPTIEDSATGICTIDLKGADFAHLSSTAHAATAELTRLGLPATAGLARTPLLALYAARAVHPDAGENVRFIAPADEKSFLAPLPLATADPSPQLAEVFASWGLRTLGDFTALPRDEIVRRFGAEGLALWKRATGGSTRPLHPVTPPREFAARMEFENEIEALDPLLFILRRFLDRLTLELRAAQFVAAEIDLTLSLEDDTRHALHLRLPEPTAEGDILYRALHTRLESLRTAACITALELRLTPARPLVRQQGLFETSLRDPHGFAETLARVAAIVGSDRVGTPQRADTHRPDAVRLTAPLAAVPAPAAPPVHPPLAPPLRRFRPPLPARVEFTAGRPTYVWTEQVHGEIVAQSCAYPSNGDWWQPDRAWQRTEWDIALADGGLYRLLLVERAWFIEGEYD